MGIEPAGHLGNAAVRAGSGVRETRLADTVILEAKRRRGGGSGLLRRHPFEVIRAGVVEGSDPPVPLVRVNLDSWLTRDRESDSKITIVGLGEPFEILVDQFIYLKVTFSTETNDVEAVTIEHGEHWPEYPRPVAFDSPSEENRRQIAHYVLIAFTQAPPEGDVYTMRKSLVEGIQLVQCLSMNLRLCRGCDGSDSVILSEPGPVPGPPLPEEEP